MRHLNIYMGNISCVQVVVPYSCGILRSCAEMIPIIKENTTWQPFICHALDGVQAIFETIKNPDVLALSCYLWNVNHNKKLARLVKQKYPNCLIIQGGSSIPDILTNFDEFPHTDILVHGEGEIPFRNILIQLINEENKWSSIAGISFLNEGKIQTNSKNIKENTIDYPSPYLQGYFKDNEYDIKLRNIPVTALFETNRGCPYKCGFCTIGDSSFGKVRMRDWEMIQREIEYYGKYVEELMVADSNFGMFDRDVDIANKIAEQVDLHGVIKTWHASFAKATNDKINDRVFEIGKILEGRNLSRQGVTISLQSNTDKVLTTIGRINATPEKFRALQQRFNKEDIAHFTELIIGLPEETVETFLDTVEFVLEGYPIELRTYTLMLLENTQLNSDYIKDKYQFKIRVVGAKEGTEQDEHEYHKQVIGTRDIPEKELTKLLKWGETLQYLYLGKWLYFISDYLKKEKGIRVVDFYKSLSEYSFDHKDSVLGKCTNNWYIKNWNSNNFVAFKGPISPYGINWKNTHFQKNIFHWLCISLEREQFYNEIKYYLKEQYIWDEEFEELFRYQQEAMLIYDFDINTQPILRYNYNWFEYFHNNDPLKIIQNSILYKTTHIGRYRELFIPNNSVSYFKAAGGYLSHFQKMNAFFHRTARIQYTDGKIIEYEPSTSSGKPKIIEE